MAPEESGPLAVADPGRMIGRELEFDRVRAAWDDAASGHTRLVLVAGEPGTGKTRLAAEVAGQAAAAGATALVGRCRQDAPLPYEPFVDALIPVLSRRPDAWFVAHAERHGAGLGRLFPDIAGRLPSAAGDEHIGPRARFIGALASAVTEPDHAATVLILEDLHWATASTVLVLDHLVRHGSAAPLLVVGTYRASSILPNHPLARLLDDPSLPRPERVFLDELPPQSVAALLVDRAAVAGANAAPLANALWRTTEGRPLVVTELIRDFIAAKGLASGSVDWKRIEKVGLAADVAAVVERRLRAGGARMRAVLEAAATIGPAFDKALVVELTGSGDDAVDAALRKAVDASLVVGESQPEPAGRYRFSHDQVREVIYDGIAVNHQVRLQHELAARLEQPERVASVPPAVLVHHLAEATPVGRSPAAVEHAVAAGHAAMAVLAYDEASGYFGQALAFLGGGGDDTDAGRRCDLLMLLGDAHHLAGESARARQSYLQAAAIAHGHQDGPRLGRAVLGLGGVLDVWGADGLLIGLLDDAVKANADDPSMQARLLARLAQARAALDTPDERKVQSDRAWELAWDSRDADTMGAVLRARHEALSAPDDLEDRVEIDGELAAMATSGNDPALGVLAHGWRVVDLLEQGHVADADRDRKSHAQLARRSGDVGHQRDAAVWSAAWALLEGRPTRAAAHIDRALALGERCHDPSAGSTYWTQQHGLLFDWGSDAELDGLVNVWRDLVRSHDQAPAWRASLGLLLVRTGRFDEAAVELDDLVDACGPDLPLDRVWLPAVAAMGEVAAALGDPRAAAVADLLQPYSRRLIVVGNGLVCRGSVARVLGLLHATTGKWNQAERQFQAALTAHDTIGAGPLLARTRSDFGRALASKPGGPLHAGRVKTTLEQAAGEADACGMTYLAVQTRAALRAIA